VRKCWWLDKRAEKEINRKIHKGNFCSFFGGGNGMECQSGVGWDGMGWDMHVEKRGC